MKLVAVLLLVSCSTVDKPPPASMAPDPIGSVDSGAGSDGGANSENDAGQGSDGGAVVDAGLVTTVATEDGGNDADAADASDATDPDSAPNLPATPDAPYGPPATCLDFTDECGLAMADAGCCDLYSECSSDEGCLSEFLCLRSCTLAKSAELVDTLTSEQTLQCVDECSGSLDGGLSALSTAAQNVLTCIGNHVFPIGATPAGTQCFRCRAEQCDDAF